MGGGLNAQSSSNSFFRTKHGASDQFFINSAIPHLKIEIKGTNLVALRRNNRAYVRSTIREGDTVYSDVGIHVKGAAGSSRDLDDKPALTLHFNKFRDGQRFHGLDKIHLNNSVQDPSYLTELLCGELFRAARMEIRRVQIRRSTLERMKKRAGQRREHRLPAQQAVDLNGRDLGLFVLKEGFDKTFLRQYFKNVNGNLWDGGFLQEISGPLQKMSGAEPGGYAPLKALVAASEEPDFAKRLEKLEQVVDVDRFISFIAMEVMTWHWDGYAMKRNNYRVYHDPDSGKIVFFAHGMDQMFWEPNGPVLPPNLDGLVARSLLQTVEGRRRYRERMGVLLTNVFRVAVLTNRINEVQARIRPELAAINPNEARAHDDSVNSLRNQIVQRAIALPAGTDRVALRRSGPSRPLWLASTRP